MPKNGRMVRLAQVALAVAFLALTAFFFRSTPTRSESYAPIDIHGSGNQWLSGRDISARVTAVYSTRIVRWDRYTGDAEAAAGRWLVVEMECASISKAESFKPELRVDNQIFRTEIEPAPNCGPPGVPIKYTCVFDVPRNLGNLTLMLTSSQSKFIDLTVEGWPIDSRLMIDMPVSMLIDRKSVDIPNSGGRI
ncbi:hypothetical protein BI330_02990 [Mycobacterium sp. CBMA 623]|nr:hypothetical protein [Mycobacteroides sp. CBMA 326]